MQTQVEVGFKNRERKRTSFMNISLRIVKQLEQESIRINRKNNEPSIKNLIQMSEW